MRMIIDDGTILAVDGVLGNRMCGIATREIGIV
jgi:hypothetical protein